MHGPTSLTVGLSIVLPIRCRTTFARKTIAADTREHKTTLGRVDKLDLIPAVFIPRYFR